MPWLFGVDGETRPQRAASDGGEPDDSGDGEDAERPAPTTAEDATATPELSGRGP